MHSLPMLSPPQFPWIIWSNMIVIAILLHDNPFLISFEQVFSQPQPTSQSSLNVAAPATELCWFLSELEMW